MYMYTYVRMYCRRQTKVPIYRPYNGTGNSVLFPFNFRAVVVLVHFQTIPILSQGQPVRSAERPPYGVIKHAQSLIAQEGSRQFSDHDRARARATCTYHGNRAAEWIAAVQ